MPQYPRSEGSDSAAALWLKNPQIIQYPSSRRSYSAAARCLRKGSRVVHDGNVTLLTIILQCRAYLQTSGYHQQPAQLFNCCPLVKPFPDASVPAAGTTIQRLPAARKIGYSIPWHLGATSEPQSYAG
jgi:hypothetical protein